MPVVKRGDPRAAQRFQAASGAARGGYLCAPGYKRRRGFGGGGSASCDLLRAECGGFDQSGASLLPPAVAVAADGDDLAVVEPPVEDRGGGDRVGGDGAPGGKGGR